MKYLFFVCLASIPGISVAQSTKTTPENKTNHITDVLPKEDENSKKEQPKDIESNTTPSDNVKQVGSSANVQEDEHNIPFIKKEVTTPEYIDNTSQNFDLSKRKFREIFSFTLNNYWLLSGLAVVTENGDVFMEMKYLDQDFLSSIKPEILKRIDNKLYLVINHEYISLLDQNKLAIEAVLPPEYFLPQKVKFNQKGINHAEPISAYYFNYALSANPKDFGNTFNGLFDLNFAHRSNWLLKNSFTINNQKNFRRGNTTWSKEFDNKYEVTFGDIGSPAFNDFTSVNIFGGRLTSPYFTNRVNNLNTLQTLDINGYSINPGKLDIYINDQLYRSTDVTTGKYNITIPKVESTGFGVAKAITYDKLGNPVVVEIPFFSDSRLVKPGAFEYEITGGVLRDTYKTGNFNYSSKPLVAGQLLIGVTERFSQNLFFTASSEYAALGGTSHYFVGPTIGKVALDWGINDRSQSYGSLEYQINATKDFSFGAKVTSAISGDSFCFGYSNSCLKNSATLNAAYRAGDIGSFNFSHNQVNSTLGNSKMTTLQYSKQIGGRLSFTATAGINKNSYSEKSNKSINFSFNYHFGSMSANSNIQRNNDTNMVQNSLVFNEDISKPWLGYGNLTQSSSQGNNTYNASYGANLNKFSYNLNATSSAGNTAYAGTVSGGMYYVPSEGKYGLSKNITSGLALVEVTNSTGPIAVEHENKHSGFTDKDGFYAVPNIRPHNTETISLDINRLPENMIVNEHKKDFVVPSNGAVKIKFEGSANPFLIRIYGVEEGSLLKFNNELYVIGSKGRTTVAQEGKLSIEIAAGKFCELDISRKQKEYYCGVATPENKFPKQNEESAQTPATKEPLPAENNKPSSTSNTPVETKKEDSSPSPVVKESSPVEIEKSPTTQNSSSENKKEEVIY